MSGPTVNIAAWLTRSAGEAPHQRAVVFPAGRDRAGRVAYTHFTFAQLDAESDRLAWGLTTLGVKQGTRIVLMVRPSLEFIALTFALFKTGAVVVLIDPGLGRKRVLGCLQEVEPQGFVAVPLVQAIRVASWKFPQATLNVTVGRRWFWSGPTYQTLLKMGDVEAGRASGAGEVAFRRAFPIAPTQATDPAAILFTSGSTGPPKGVLYEHGMFAAQVEWLRELYQIQPGEIDLPGFPLFALFNSAMRVTTVIPDMDPTRPARVDPCKIVEAIENHGVTQAFGSPAIWLRVGRYCHDRGLTLTSMKRVLSAGAPVPESVLNLIKSALPNGAEMFTPYGATESLPVASIGAAEVLEETAAKTRTGAGTCIGKPVPRIEVKIIAISAAPIPDWKSVQELPPGEVGEIVVRGAVVTREYFQRPEATALAKIADGDTFWHRMGDVGYFDTAGRLWFCGRKAHIVNTATGPQYTDCVEPIFNAHPQVFRTALVGVGPATAQTPVIVVERSPGGTASNETLMSELREMAKLHPHTRAIDTFLFHPSLPVDIRHNVKISREELAVWAAKRLT